RPRDARRLPDGPPARAGRAPRARSGGTHRGAPLHHHPNHGLRITHEPGEPRHEGLASLPGPPRAPRRPRGRRDRGARGPRSAVTPALRDADVERHRLLDALDETVLVGLMYERQLTRPEDDRWRLPVAGRE